MLSLHAGSRRMARNTDRFSSRAFEEIAGEAARLGVSAGAVRQYMDWYGDAPLAIRQGGQAVTRLPAYEVRLRQDAHGERLVVQTGGAR